MHLRCNNGIKVCDTELKISVILLQILHANRRKVTSGNCCCRQLWKQDYLTLPYLTGKACYCLAMRPPVGPMRVPDLTLRLLEPLGVFLANLKSELQCSCLNSLGNKRCFPNRFLHFSTRALHLPRRCRLVSYSSPQRGHTRSSFVFGKVRCRFSVFCPVRRPTKIFKSVRNNLTA